MNFETNEASFRIELGQALNGHPASMIQDTIPNLEVPKCCYYAFCPSEGSHIVLGVDWVAQEGRRPAFYDARLPQETTFIGSSGILPP